MKLAGRGVGLVAGAVAIGLMATACSNDDKAAGPPSTPSSSAAAAPSSSAAPSGSGTTQSIPYSDLLIKPTDIAIAGDTFTSLGAPEAVAGGAGAKNQFLNADASRSVDASVYINADPGQAVQMLDGTAAALTDPDLGVKGGTPTPADVGNGGKMVVGGGTKGTSPKSRGEIMFTEGKAFVDLVVLLPPNEPVATDLLIDLARKQDVAIKAGLPS